MGLHDDNCLCVGDSTQLIPVSVSGSDVCEGSLPPRVTPWSRQVRDDLLHVLPLPLRLLQLELHQPQLVAQLAEVTSFVVNVELQLVQLPRHGNSDFLLRLLRKLLGILSVRKTFLSSNQEIC